MITATIFKNVMKKFSEAPLIPPHAKAALIIIISLLYHSFSLLLDHHHNLVKLVS
jgi:hypothetical protein